MFAHISDQLNKYCLSRQIDHLNAGIICQITPFIWSNQSELNNLVFHRALSCFYLMCYCYILDSTAWLISFWLWFWPEMWHQFKSGWNFQFIFNEEISSSGISVFYSDLFIKTLKRCAHCVANTSLIVSKESFGHHSFEPDVSDRFFFPLQCEISSTGSVIILFGVLWRNLIQSSFFCHKSDSGRETHWLATNKTAKYKSYDQTRSHTPAHTHTHFNFLLSDFNIYWASQLFKN